MYSLFFLRSKSQSADPLHELIPQSLVTDVGKHGIGLDPFLSGGGLILAVLVERNGSQAGRIDDGCDAGVLFTNDVEGRGGVS